MTTLLARNLSPQLVDPVRRAASLSTQSPEKPTFGENLTELLRVEELADRLRVPKSWVRAHTRARTLDPLPVVRLGRYTRFRWTAVEAWLREHEEQARG